MPRVTRSTLTRRHAAFVACLLALGACVALGAGANSATAAPTARQIDAFLGEHGSPMAGTGAVFAAEGAAHGVDPAFLVAIAGAESSFGLHLYSENGDVCAYNAFNWFYGPTWPQSDFASWSEAIARVSEGLAGDLYHGVGLYSVQAIAPRYCPDGTNKWIDNVTAFMTALGGDPSDTRVADSSAPPPTQLDLVALGGSVDLSPGEHLVGERLTTRFTISNEGGVPVTVDGITLAVRGPAGVRRDMASNEPLTLMAGETRAVQATWDLDLVGRWYGWIEVFSGGQASLVGDDTAFACRVALPRGLHLRQSALRDVALDPAR